MVAVELLRENLRQTEACIIDMEGEHVTVALRLPKTVVAAHHQFLTAISESIAACGPDPVLLATTAPPALASKKFRRFAKSLFNLMPAGAALVSFLAVAAAFAHFELRPPPIDVASVTAVSDEIHKGSPLLLKVVAKHWRDCIGEYDHIITTDKGDAALRERTYGSTIRVSDGLATKIVPINVGNILTGKYVFRAYDKLDCGWMDQAVLELGPIPFEVIP